MTKATSKDMFAKELFMQDLLKLIAKHNVHVMVMGVVLAHRDEEEAVVFTECIDGVGFKGTVEEKLDGLCANLHTDFLEWVSHAKQSRASQGDTPDQSDPGASAEGP